MNDIPYREVVGSVINRILGGSKKFTQKILQVISLRIPNKPMLTVQALDVPSVATSRFPWLSTTEAEYISLCQCMQQLIIVKLLLKELGFLTAKAVTIREDN
ncbi:hypothetical protein PHMEG_00012073 [Phytophthora megakarya]|uniref:Uncharacterized protein n=1 Tax=Phytophthora megakarya TaxID=4795 RepID=A0A225WBC8_9STRA|nr:hypothetical protein PHMEG_00012073 [Phytophthora megakarya]